MHLPWRDVTVTEGVRISTSMTDAEANTLAVHAAGKRVLEAGSAFGYSACVMGLAGAQSIVAIDPHEWLNSLDPMKRNLAACGVLDKVEIWSGLQAKNALATLAGQGRKFDFIFVDGDHRAAAVEYDLRWALKLIEPDGFIAVHDTEEACCCPDVKVVASRFFPDGPVSLSDTLAVYHS